MVFGQRRGGASSNPTENQCDQRRAGIRPTGQDLAAIINRNKQLQGVRVAWSLATLREGTTETAGYLSFDTTRELRAFHFALLVFDTRHDMERTFLFRVVRLLVWHTRIISALSKEVSSVLLMSLEFW